MSWCRAEGQNIVALAQPEIQLLFQYRLAGFWDAPPDREDLNQLSVQALATDPLTGHLWVGTRTGLYSAHNWVHHRQGDVRALAFSPEGLLWVGTTTGLEQWPPPSDGAVFAGEPAQRLTSINSGLAADTVTALAIRGGSDRREVWIGSPAGVSCYRYSS